MGIKKNILSLVFIICSYNFGLAAEIEQKEAQFLHQMSNHHQQAVKMAQMAEKKSSSSEVKKLSRQIVKDQKNEIVQMSKWRNKNTTRPTDMDKHANMGTKKGMDMGIDMDMKMDMSELKKLSGNDFDAKYLDMMSEHHSQAISMVGKYKPDLQDPAIKQFAENIVQVQQKEIEQMTKLKEETGSR